EASFGLKPLTGQGYEIHCVAPTQHDLSSVSGRLRDIVQNGPYHPALSARIDDFLRGVTRSLGESRNPLSLAVVIKWGDIRLLLAGDVTNGDGHAQSGWRG